MYAFVFLPFQRQYRAVIMWVKCALIVEANSKSSRPARDLVGQYDEIVQRSLRMIAELELAARGYRLYASFFISHSFILTFRIIY